MVTDFALVYLIPWENFLCAESGKKLRGRACYTSNTAQVGDKRLSIELAGLRQTFWEDDIPSHEAFTPYGDILRRIATHLRLADCLTKSVKPHLLNEAICSNKVIVADRAPEPLATTENEPTAIG